MAILEIELQPDEQAKLEQEAQTEGVSIEDWARRRLTGAMPPQTFAEIRQSPRDAHFEPAAKPLWEIVAELDAIEIPAAERARLPHDGSINYKHYLYGAPKVDVPEELR